MGACVRLQASNTKNNRVNNGATWLANRRNALGRLRMPAGRLTIGVRAGGAQARARLRKPALRLAFVCKFRTLACKQMQHSDKRISENSGLKIRNRSDHSEARQFPVGRENQDGGMVCRDHVGRGGRGSRDGRDESGRLGWWGWSAASGRLGRSGWSGR